MELLQILAILFALFALSRAILRMKDGNLSMHEFLLWNVIWITILIFAFVPDVSTIIANLFGIGRGVDFLLYVSVIVLFYLIFRLYVKTEKAEQDITKLVSYVALNKNINLRKKK